MPWLEETYPELVAGYRRLYRGSNAPKAVREQISERVRAEKRRHRTFASPATVTARRLPNRRPGDSAAPDSQPRDSPTLDPPGVDPGPTVQLTLGLG